MPIAKLRNLDIAYESFGDSSNEAMLLFVGLGGQLVDWEEPAVAELVSHGFYVIRFDNRDSGHSSHLAELGSPDLISIFMGKKTAVPYGLADMADDALSLMDYLEIEVAHLVGVSMGAMIAQELCVAHPESVLSLASIMSSTGAKKVGAPSTGVVNLLLASMANGGVDPFEFAKVISSPGYPFVEENVRNKLAQHAARSVDVEGTMRQLAAVLTTADRTEELRRLSIPTVVIHGSDDPLVDISGGRATAAAIRGAKFIEMPGMGHDVPIEAWPTIRDEIVSNAKRAHYAV